MRYNHNCTESDIDDDFFHIWPTPFESVDAGEVFMWESYHFTILRSPSLYGYHIDDIETTLNRLMYAVTCKRRRNLSAKELMRRYLDDLQRQQQKTIKEKNAFKAFLKLTYTTPPMSYNYALIAYKTNGEHTFLSNPVLCVGIVNFDYSIYESLNKVFNDEFFEPLEGDHKTFYLLSKIGEHRKHFHGGFQLQPYLKELTSESQKNSLCNVTMKQLGLSGYPKFVSSIDSLRNKNFRATY
jgi:hypothetical protein